MAEVKIPTAREWMTTDVLEIEPELDLLEAIGAMADRSVTGAIVVDSDGALHGILTEKDCLRVLSLSSYHEARSGKVADFMSPVPECATPGMDLFRVSQLFLSTNFPIIPVVHDDRVVGQITRQHMLRAIQAVDRRLAAESRVHAEGIEGAADRPRSIEDMQKTFAESSRDQLIRRIKRRG